MKPGCPDLYFLSTLACRLAECVDDDDLPVLASSLTVLGDMIAVIVARQDACRNHFENPVEKNEEEEI